MSSTNNTAQSGLESDKPIENIMGNDEEIMVENSSNPKDARFDMIVGQIEDIIIDQRFQDSINAFMDRSYTHFENSDENKLIYTDLHREYLSIIEKFIENELKVRVENFSMEEFMNDLSSRRDEMDCEIFDILVTYEDFVEFKQLMLSHKASKEGKSLDLSIGLTIQSISLTGSNIKNNNNNSNTQEIKTDDKKQSMTDKKQNTKKSSTTPLLDKIQIDSDHEQCEMSTN